MNSILNNDLAKYLDFAKHDANTTHMDVEYICKQVLLHAFNAVFLNPCYIEYARKIVGEKAHIGSVVSFPLGQEILNTKINTTQSYFLRGADELDVMLNVGMIKEEQWDHLLEEMNLIVNIARTFDGEKIIKFIPETGYLTTYQIQKVAELIARSGANFIKTCSGYGPRGATIEDVALIRQTIGNTLKIKVAGGITTREQAIYFIHAGADRIGTSHALEIING